MIKFKLFSHLLQNLQQFKCNEYGTKWCSIKRVTKVSYPSRIPANIISSVESQKGDITIQRCSIETRRVLAHCTKSIVIAPFWFSMEHLCILIVPFWLSTDDIMKG